jgi:hypothetical protein
MRAILHMHPYRVVLSRPGSSTPLSPSFYPIGRYTLRLHRHGPEEKAKESTLSEDSPRFQLLRFTQPVTRMTERWESSDVLLYSLLHWHAPHWHQCSLCCTTVLDPSICSSSSSIHRSLWISFWIRVQEPGIDESQLNVNDSPETP